MKWTNRGHQLDSLGVHYKNITTIFIWGVGKNGFECLDFLKWLKEFEDFKVILIDSDKQKQKTSIGDTPIQPPQFYLTNMTVLIAL